MPKNIFAEGNQYGKLATGVPKTFTEESHVARLANLGKARSSPKYAKRDLSIPLQAAWAARITKYSHQIEQFDPNSRKAFCKKCGWVMVKVLTRRVSANVQLLCYVNSLSYKKEGPTPSVIYPGQVWDMWEKQGGKCKICSADLLFNQGINKSAILDHCHTSGKIRGWICQGCNQGLGSFRDNPEALRLAASYIEEHQAGLAEENTNGK